MNRPQYSRYQTVEMSVNKRYGSRWSASLGGAYTWMTEFPNSYPQNPNQPGVEDRTVWNFKASGSYDAPYGIRLSPILRHQSGANYAREYTIATPSGLFVTGVNNNRAMPSRPARIARTISGCSTCARKRR